MRIRLSLSIIILGACCAILGTAVYGGNQRLQAWQSNSISSRYPSIPLDLQPTLPAPVLFREPEFSWGLSNALHWSSDSVSSILKPIGARLLFFEIQAVYPGNELWGFVETGVDSAQFVDLPESIRIEYKLRYYAQTGAGSYEMSHWSIPQYSIQDNHFPKLKNWDIAGLQKTFSGNWVVGRTISIHFQAEDSSGGKIMKVLLREISLSGDRTFQYDFQRPAVQVDTTIPYIISAPNHTEIELRIGVVDVSGQPSPMESIRFFWWPPEGDTAGMICFPNPFNPESGQISTIKLDSPGHTEARIFDPFGNQIRVLYKESGNRFFEWNGRNDRGIIVSNGAYFCVLRDNQRLYCKIVVLK